jgi:hypothetical protein
LKFPTSYFEKTWDGVPKILPAVKDDVLSPESSHDSTTPEVMCDRATMHEFFEMLPESELISEPTSTAFENELVNWFAYGRKRTHFPCD